jgi:hypothetical protein
MTKSKIRTIRLNEVVSKTSDKIEDVNERKCRALEIIYSSGTVLGMLETKGDVIYVVK